MIAPDHVILIVPDDHLDEERRSKDLDVIASCGIHSTSPDSTVPWMHEVPAPSTLKVANDFKSLL